MAIFLCLICISIYDKMHGFIDESGLLIFLFIFYLFFCLLCRNSRWPPKVAGQQFLRKGASRLCRYPVGQKFRREIQDGRQKWWENDFCEKSPVYSANTLWVKNFIEIALSHSVSKINAL